MSDTNWEEIYRVMALGGVRRTTSTAMDFISVKKALIAYLFFVNKNLLINLAS